jgi:uncharacterized protein YndB with AHSA1/START domain
MDSTDGTLEQADGRWRLRFTRHLGHPRAKVWRAITEAGHLAAWFPQKITGDWAPGGELIFSDPQGRGPDFTGQVLAYQPPELLEFSWGPDVIRLELAEAGDGCTLTLLDTLDERGTAARTAAGWHECLDRLAYHTGGLAAPFSDGERWSQTHPGYVTAFGPEGSSAGPPPGYEPGQS